MNALAIDTSSDELSVALLKNDVVCAEITFNSGENHSVTILSAIKYIYEIARIGTKDIDLFIGTQGPGSFTGLRVGLSTIKGLAMVAGRPVIGISSLEALALNALPCSLNICPMLDAQRGYVYTALYKTHDNITHLPISEEILSEVGPFLRRLRGNTLFIGKGALNNMVEIKKTMPTNSFFLPFGYNFIRATSVAILGIRKFNNGQVTDSMDILPRYLQSSEAERKLEG